MRATSVSLARLDRLRSKSRTRIRAVCRPQIGRAITQLCVPSCNAVAGPPDRPDNPPFPCGLRMRVDQPRPGTPFAPRRPDTFNGASVTRLSVRVKKAKEPPRLIRYMLSADRKLRRISL